MGKKTDRILELEGRCTEAAIRGAALLGMLQDLARDLGVPYTHSNPTMEMHVTVFNAIRRLVEAVAVAIIKQTKQVASMTKYLKPLMNKAEYNSVLLGMLLELARDLGAPYENENPTITMHVTVFAAIRRNVRAVAKTADAQTNCALLNVLATFARQYCGANQDAVNEWVTTWPDPQAPEALASLAQLVPLLPGAPQTFDKLVDKEIERVNSNGGASLRDYSIPFEVVEALEPIARELGVSVEGNSLDTAIETIHGRLLALKNPSGDISADAGDPNVSKGDSLAEAMEHNASVRRELEVQLRRNREIVSRVAAAMQVSQWDADGTEIVEKVQRWDGIKHRLRTYIRTLRLRATRSVAPDRTLVDDAEDRCADELEAILARLVSSEQMAKWFSAWDLHHRTGDPCGGHDKKPAAIANIVLAVDSLPPTPHDKLLNSYEVQQILEIMSAPKNHRDPNGKLPTLFADMRFSSTARGEFQSLMNLIIIPILARQSAATTGSTEEDKRG